MNEPPVVPNIEGMGGIYREIIHLLGLLDGQHIQHGSGAAIRFLKLIADFEVSNPDPLAAQSRVSGWCGPLLWTTGDRHLPLSE